MQWPSKIAPTKRPLLNLVSHLDLVPTLLHAANIGFEYGAPSASGRAAHSNVRYTHSCPDSAKPAGQHMQQLTVASLASCLLKLSNTCNYVLRSQVGSFPPKIEAHQSAGAFQLQGCSLADLIMNAARHERDQAVVAGKLSGQHGWVHGTSQERVLYCEVGQSRAVFTSRYRLLYSPRIKPLAKGGTTDLRHNYQSNRHHTSYWRPLQLYDVSLDPNEQHNLMKSTERTLLNITGDRERAVMKDLSELRALLKEHLEYTRLGCGVEREALASKASFSPWSPR